MFKEFFLKELGIAFKRPMIYIFFLIVSLLVFGAVVSDNVQIGGAIGNVYKNAPSVVTTFVTILNIFGLLFATAYFNNAALRDHSHGFNEIMFSAPISKPGYYFGRFFGALIAATFVMSGVYFGVIAGTFVGPAVGWIGPERVGPIPWKTFINSYFIFILPNMFFAGALIYGLASKFKNTIISFVGTLIIIIGYIVSLNMMSDLDSESTAAIADVFAVSTVELDTKYFTPQEKNTIAPSFSGFVRTNRILWTSIGTLILLFFYGIFSFKTKSRKVKAKKKEAKSSNKIYEKPSIAAVANVGTWTQFTSFFKINLLSIMKSNVFIILFLFSIIILVSNIFNGFEYFGLQSFPVTYKLMDEIQGLSSMFIYIIIVFFSGELVWRDRDFHLNEVVDGTPHNSVVSLLAKTLSLILLACSMYIILIFTAVIFQALNGYTHFELGVYFTDFFYRGFIPFTIMSCLMVFIQVAMNQKYLGYFISILVIFVWDLMLLLFKVESNMLSIAGRPSLMYSDMNGFGPGLKSAQWFSGYWILLGLLLLLLGGLLWPRGKNSKLRDRAQQGMKTLSKSYIGVVGLVGVVWLAVSGFVFYNTQVLNTYDTSKQTELLQVDYEKKYKQYENITKPKIIDIVYNIDIYPEERNVDAKGRFVLVNKSDQAIEEIHINYDKSWETNIEMDAETSLDDKKLGYRIMTLNSALQPMDTMVATVTTKYITKGFSNSIETESIVKNGTFLNNFQIMPSMGYSKDFEISDKNKRRKYDLPERDRTPELEEVCSESCMINYLSSGSADWVNVETFISTSSDQVAVAPGSMISMEENNGRKNYHYKLDHPSMNFYSFISADYEIATRKWNGVDLEVYYHKGHEYNIERMLDAIQKSLEYYTENFGPYYHKQARIIEFPRYANFAQAFPGTMPYSESFGFIIDLEGEDKNNVIDAVIAHEMAHQYWAHQVIGAEMQGATMLSESFAEYSALMVMKQTTDDVQMKDFLRYDMNRYLRGRSREVDKEVPLHKVENQGHIHYGKGSIIMYALQDYIGEDSINMALSEFLDMYKYQEPPYPTSLDFLKFLEPKVPDSLQYLIDDWIKDITLYDLRMKEASYTALGNGKYEVTIDLENYKVKADTIGNETQVAINDWVDVGFYKDRDEEDLFFIERKLINNQDMQMTFVLDTIPAKAAIDPRRILIERVYKDNVKIVDSTEE